MQNLDNNSTNASKIFSFVTSRGFLLVAVVVLILLLLRQCGETSNAKTEALREHNNYLAMHDSVRTIKKENGILIQEKSGMEIKISEMTGYQKYLIGQLDLKSNGRGNTPNSVINVVTRYKDSIVNIPSKLVKDPNGKEHIEFVYEPKFTGKNSLKISGKTNYQLGISKDKADSYFATLNPTGTDLTIDQNIEITTGIYRDPKTKRIMTRVSTQYPNLTFSEINSFDITDNKETRQVLRSARKPFGVGLNAGYGIIGGSNGIGTGFYFGVGVSYSPKFLQFGK